MSSNPNNRRWARRRENGHNPREPRRQYIWQPAGRAPNNRAQAYCWRWATGQGWRALTHPFISQPVEVEAEAWRLAKEARLERACFNLALYAHCRTVEEVYDLAAMTRTEEYRRPPIGIHAVMQRLKVWAKRSNRLFQLSVMDDQIATNVVWIGNAGAPVARLCLFEFEECFHLAPTVNSPLVEESGLVFEEVASSSPAPAPPPTSESTDSSVGVEELSTIPSLALDSPAPQTQEMAVGTEEEDAWPRGTIPLQSAIFSLQMDQGLWGVRWFDDPIPARERYTLPYYEYYGKTLYFWGELVPRCLRLTAEHWTSDVEHCGGWLASEVPEQGVNYIHNYVQSLGFDRPDVVSATASAVKTFGVGGVFVPLQPEDLTGLQQIGARMFTDGLREVVPFYEGDRVVVQDCTYVVRRFEAPRNGALHFLHCPLLTLKLVDTKPREVWKSLLSRVPWASERRNDVIIHPPTSSVAAGKMVNRSKWMIASLMEKDPVRCALINRQRLSEAKHGFEDDPEEKLILLKQLAEKFPKTKPCLGAFRWGFCFSCGIELPSKKKFPSRLCRACLSGNSTLGKVVEVGDKVCSAATRVQYPGVVWTTSKHPDLKNGVKTVASDESLKITGMSLEQALTKAPIERPGPTLFGIGMDGAIPFVSSGGVRPLVEAICYRVFKDIPRTAEKEVFDKLHKLIDNSYLLGGLLWRKISPMLQMDWAKSIPNSRRRKMLIKAIHSLVERGELHPKAGEFSSFPKSENLPYFAQTQEGTDWEQMRYVARLINGPFDEDHVITGPSFKPLLAELKKVWHVHNWIFYASVAPSKLNLMLEEIADCPSFLCSDFTAFDSTFTDYTWDLLESIYRRVLVDVHPEFWEILRRWRQPKSSAFMRKEHCKVKFQAQTCNASGRDDTALANALFNGLATACSLAAAISGKSLERLSAQDLEGASRCLKISIVGDDSLVAADFDLEPFREAYEMNIKRFGLIVKAQIYHSIHDVTFLGQAPYTNRARQWAWGPTIGRRLYKAGWKLDRGGNYPAWLHGVAQQTALYANVPLVSDWAQRTLELMQGQKRTDVVYDENRPWAMPDVAMFSYDEVTLTWVAYRYREQGVSVPMLRRDIAALQAVERLPAVIHLESMDRILLQDEL